MWSQGDERADADGAMKILSAGAGVAELRVMSVMRMGMNGSAVLMLPDVVTPTVEVAT